MSDFEQSPRGWTAPRWMDQAAGASWRLLVTLAFVAVLVGVLIAAEVVVLPLLLSLMITSVLSPVMQLIHRRGVSRGWASLLTLLAVVAAVLVALTVAVRSIAGSWSDLAANMSKGLQKLEQKLQAAPLHLSSSQAHQTTDAAHAAGAKVVGVLAQGVVSVIPAITTAAATALLTLVMTFFFLRDGRNIWRWSMTQVPGANLALLYQIAARSWRTIGGYVKGQAIIATFDGVMIGIGLALIGVPLAVPLAILTFFLAFIPTLGAIIAGAAATLVGFAHGGLTDAVLVILLTLGVNQSEALLSPFVVGRAVNLHPLVVLLASTVGMALAGVVGGFLAVPVTAVTYGAFQELRGTGFFGDELEEPPEPGAGEPSPAA
ncbi:MAG: AI-2E family transporter [Gaiellales bacterium]